MRKQLSKEQLEKLRELQGQLKHPKLKKLLKRAIRTWETTRAANGWYGVFFSDNKITADNSEGCCLIGAGINGCKISLKDWENGGYTRSLWYVSGFSNQEFEVIYKTFDAYHQQTYQILYNGYKDKVKNLKLLIDEVSQIGNICFKG